LSSIELKIPDLVPLDGTNMIKISTDLPFRYRVDINFIKRRGAVRAQEKLFPSLKKVASAKNGNKISVFFRHIFEHKNIKRILGSHIALAVLATSIVPVSASNQASLPEQVIVSTSEVKIKTEAHIQWPLSNNQINQNYHFFHPGIDLEGVTGEHVRPIMAGEVFDIQYSSYAYGNAVLVRHGDNFSSLYAHLSEIKVEKGQKVSLDTVIGYVGSTGRSSGDHLHLEIRENGRPINPFSMLPKN
jgi:murein DD-endopeptidase MepM/ murein hydrolase activator NlpD